MKILILHHCASVQWRSSVTVSIILKASGWKKEGCCMSILIWIGTTTILWSWLATEMKPFSSIYTIALSSANLLSQLRNKTENGYKTCVGRHKFSYIPMKIDFHIYSWGGKVAYHYDAIFLGYRSFYWTESRVVLNKNQCLLFGWHLSYWETEQF